MTMSVTPRNPTSRTDFSSATQTSGAPLFSSQEVAAWWESLRPKRDKAETGIAVRRFRAYASTIDPELLWLALGEVAVEGLPAIWFTEQIARERVARIRETVREMEKREERSSYIRPDRGLRSIADILGGAA